MEPSFEEGFSFLDLDDCDEEARSYLQTVIEKRGPPPSQTGMSVPVVQKPPEHMGLTEGSYSKIHSKDAPKDLETTRNASRQPNASKFPIGEQLSTDGSIQDRSAPTRVLRLPTQAKEINAAKKYTAPSSITPSSRVSERGGQQPSNSFQAPLSVKVKPIQQMPVSIAASTFLPSAQQVGNNRLFTIFIIPYLTFLSLLSRFPRAVVLSFYILGKPSPNLWKYRGCSP